MKRSVRRWLYSLLLSVLACMLSLSTSASVSAQTWRGTYCIAWNQQIRPHRIVASGNILAGETINLVIPPPTYPDTIQYVALSWGTDMNMQDTRCTWRVVPASGTYLMQAPTSGATLWEWQIVEVDVRTVDALNPQPRQSTLRELPVPGSVQFSLDWALNGEIVRWALMIMLGAYLAWWWLRAILDIVSRWRESPQDGDKEWEEYNAERGIAYDEEAGEFYRVDRL